MRDEILELAPMRWKIFQCLAVRGENLTKDGEKALRNVKKFLVTDADYQAFLDRHAIISDKVRIAEPNNLMQASYFILVRQCTTPHACSVDGAQGHSSSFCLMCSLLCVRSRHRMSRCVSSTAARVVRFRLYRSSRISISHCVKLDSLRRSSKREMEHIIATSRSTHRKNKLHRDRIRVHRPQHRN
jgi:hypothetical protein